MITVWVDHPMSMIQQKLLYFLAWGSGHLVASLVFLQSIPQPFSGVRVCVSTLSHLLFFLVLLCFTSTINQSLNKGLSWQLTHPKYSSVNVYSYYFKTDHVDLAIVVKVSPAKKFLHLFFLYCYCQMKMFLKVFNTNVSFVHRFYQCRTYCIT